MAAKRKIRKGGLHFLTARHVEFCKLYATNTGNATQCYIDAGLRCPLDTSGDPVRPAAGKLAWQLLKKSEISGLIREFRRSAMEAAKIDANFVAESLKLEATFPRRSVFDKQGRVKPPHKWPKELDHFVSGYTVKETTVLLRDAATGQPERDEHGAMVFGVQREYTIRFTQQTEAKRILAQWLGMVGDKDVAAKAPPKMIRVVMEPDPTEPPPNIEDELAGDEFADDADEGEFSGEQPATPPPPTPADDADEDEDEG